MLIESVMEELPLLLFSVFLTIGVSGYALLALARGFGAGEEVDPKLDKLATIPFALEIVGLVAAMFHLGKITNIFYMIMGFGTSPLTNEIVVAGVAIVLTAIFWIVGLVKHLTRPFQKAIGVLMAIVAFVVALFVGLAYNIPTVYTWSTPYAWLGMLFLAAVGGAVSATLSLSFADTGAKKSNGILTWTAIVGAIGAVIVVILQGVFAAGLENTAGTTLTGEMGTYTAFAVVGSILVLASAFLLWRDARFCKEYRRSMQVLAFVLVVVGLILIRVDFYGIYLSVGLA